MFTILHLIAELLRSTAVFRVAVAHRWWPPNDKLQWITSIVLTAAATYWASLTYRLSRARSTPILVLESDGDVTKAHNIGEGAALNTFLTQDDNEVWSFIGSVGGGERVEIKNAPRFDMNSKYYLYYHDVKRGIFGGRIWTRTTVHSARLHHQDGRPFITDHAQRIWFVPASVARRARIETPWEMMVRLSRWYDPRNWPQRLQLWWLPRYRNAKRWIDETRQSRLHEQFADEVGQFPAAEPDDVVKTGWDFCFDQSTGFCSNQSGAYQIDQLSCVLREDGVLIHVKLRVMGAGWMRGIVHIGEPTLARLMAKTRDERSTEVFDAFKKYYCRWWPRTTFIFTL